MLLVKLLPLKSPSEIGTQTFTAHFIFIFLSYLSFFGIFRSEKEMAFSRPSYESEILSWALSHALFSFFLIWPLWQLELRPVGGCPLFLRRILFRIQVRLSPFTIYSIHSFMAGQNAS